jgi:hypothetical protein
LEGLVGRRIGAIARFRSDGGSLEDSRIFQMLGTKHGTLFLPRWIAGRVSSEKTSSTRRLHRGHAPLPDKNSETDTPIAATDLPSVRTGLRREQNRNGQSCEGSPSWFHASPSYLSPVVMYGRQSIPELVPQPLWARDELRLARWPLLLVGRSVASQAGPPPHGWCGSPNWSRIRPTKWSTISAIAVWRAV